MDANFTDNETTSHQINTIIRGRDLKAMRLYAKITTSVAAEFMGIKSRKTIENWESGKSCPNIHKFVLLCLFYDMDASKIVALCMQRALNSSAEKQSIDIDVASCSTV